MKVKKTQSIFVSLRKETLYKKPCALFKKKMVRLYESLMLKMFMRLYADGTTICSESAEGLQQALDALSDYCDKWSLRVNVYKTKVVVFSRGKIRKMPTVKYKGQSLEVVFEFQYLGVCFNYNNKFNVAKKSLYDKASRAMFGLLKKM